MEWIIVKDRLPDINQPVAIYNGEDILYGTWYIDKFHGNSNGCYDESIRHEDITHWMPLPEPPKK